MTPRARQLRQIFLVALLLFVGSMLSITAYTIWRLRADAMTAGFEISAMHTRGFEDFLTQTLRVTELATANAVARDTPRQDLQQLERAFVATVRQAPFLRSISLLDESHRIIASSNPANVGTTVRAEGFLPPATNAQEILRIGPPWAGRDFADGRPSTNQAPVAADANTFIPAIRTEAAGQHAVTIIAAINPDYFLNHMSQMIPPEEGSVELLLYDGTLLGATDTLKHPGALRSDLLREMRLSEVESGQFEQSILSDFPALTTFRASRLYPFVVVTHTNRDFALRNWETEARTLLGIVITVLLAISMLGAVFYRRQLQLTEQRFENERLQRINATVFSSSPEATLITDLNDKVISINPAFSKVTGYAPTDVIGHSLLELFTDEGVATFTERILQRQGTQLPPGQSDSVKAEIQHRCKDGSLMWCEVLSTPERDETGKIVGYHRISRNIAERKRAEEQLQLAANVFLHAHEGIVITDAQGTIVDVNATFTHITGYDRDEVIGQNPRMLKSGRQEKEFYVTMWRNLIEQGHWAGEVWNRRKTGEVYAEMLTISAVRDSNGDTRHYVALFSDITDRKSMELEVHQLAFHDPLTRLPNRRLLHDRLRQTMAANKRSGCYGAVMFLDLDNFKPLNDKHGHELGDMLLIEVADRMKRCVREMDTVARFGGDEFVVMISELDADQADSTLQGMTVAEKIRNTLSEPYRLRIGGEGETGKVVVHHCTASIGVVLFSDHEASPDEVLKCADTAMYQAKESGRNSIRFCEPMA